MRIKAYRRRAESISGFDVSKRLTQLKKLPRYAWLKISAATCLVQTLRDQDSAFRHFFRRIKRGETPGFPRFRKHGDASSLRFQDISKPNWVKGIVVIPKLGAIKLAEGLPDITCPDTITLKRTSAGHFYITFSARVDKQPLPKTGQTVGIDLGLSHLAILSTGEKIDNPKKLAGNLRYLTQQQRCL